MRISLALVHSPMLPTEIFDTSAVALFFIPAAVVVSERGVIKRIHMAFCQVAASLHAHSRNLRWQIPTLSRYGGGKGALRLILLVAHLEHV